MSLEPLDASEMMDDLKAQNPDMFREFFELNCMDIHPRHVQGRRVLDVGANLGFFAIKCRTLGSGPVLCVEPHPTNFKNLQSNCVDLPGFTLLKCAVMGKGERSVSMIEGEHVGNAKAVSGGDIPAKSLKELLVWCAPHDQNLVLKLDVEGAEYDILLNASGDDLRRFAVIFVETHQVPHLEDRDARTSRYLKEYMETIGFVQESMRQMFHWGWDRNGKLNKYDLVPNQESWVLVREKGTSG